MLSSFDDVLFFKIVIRRYIPSLFRNFLTIISSLYGIIHRNNIKYRYHLCFYAIIKRRWFLMELRQIRYFMEVAKREHVTEAANALHVAQSAVSRQIFNLEEELGVELFIREGRTVKLTRIGQVFLEHMEKAMNVIDDAKQEVEEYIDPNQGTLHIGFSASLASYILPTAVLYFRKQYPNVKFVLNQGSHHELMEAVEKGDMNIALVGPVPTENKKVKSTILFTEDIVALLS